LAFQVAPPRAHSRNTYPSRLLHLPPLDSPPSILHVRSHPNPWFPRPATISSTTLVIPSFIRAALMGGWMVCEIRVSHTASHGQSEEAKSKRILWVTLHRFHGSTLLLQGDRRLRRRHTTGQPSNNLAGLAFSMPSPYLLHQLLNVPVLSSEKPSPILTILSVTRSKSRLGQSRTISPTPRIFPPSPRLSPNDRSPAPPTIALSHLLAVPNQLSLSPPAVQVTSRRTPSTHSRMKGPSIRTVAGAPLWVDRSAVWRLESH